MSQTNVFHSNRIPMITLVLVILASLMLAAFRPAAAADTTNLNIVSVEKGQSVTIRVVDMPANTEFRVLMNKIGTQGVDGTVAGTGKTGKDGSFTKTFSIPAGLKAESRIAIRIEATDKSGWYAYNWFTNSTSGSSGSTGSSTGSVPSVGGASSGNLTILDVEEDTSVEFRARNLPASRTFQVWFDWKNRNGTVKGIQGGTVKSDSDGRVVAAVKMPVALRDRNEVRLRLQATSGSSVSAFAWFLNVDSDEEAGGSAPASSSLGIPYILIRSVVKNESVTIEAYNLPKRMEFDVYMGKIGTQGEDGIFVGTVKTGKSDSTLIATLNVPNKLIDREKIAVRLEAADGSAYYAYNWFNNSTTAAGQ